MLDVILLSSILASTPKLQVTYEDSGYEISYGKITYKYCRYDRNLATLRFSDITLYDYDLDGSVDLIETQDTIAKRHIDDFEIFSKRDKVFLRYKRLMQVEKIHKQWQKRVNKDRTLELEKLLKNI